MTTPQIAERLIALCRTGQDAQARAELYAPHAVSIEVDSTTEGLEAIQQKGIAFNAGIEAFHNAYVGEPIISGDFFAVTMGMEVTMGGQRIKMDEIALYEVQNGKIVREQFFYNPSSEQVQA